MQDVEVRKNGKYQILMRPSDAVDVAVLEAMATRATSNPACLSMTYVDGVAVITVEQR